MPKYKVKPESWGICTAPESPKDNKHYPTVYFPVSSEILKGLEVGQDAEIILRGKVVGLESRESENQDNKSEVRLEVHEVEASADGVYEKMAKDESGDE